MTSAQLDSSSGIWEGIARLHPSFGAMSPTIEQEDKADIRNTFSHSDRYRIPDQYRTDSSIVVVAQKTWKDSSKHTIPTLLSIRNDHVPLSN